MEPAVSVIVPVRNGAAALPGCLDAIARQTLDGPIEVVVVDNASSDASAMIAAGHPGVTRVVHEPRPGSYRARNAGARASRGPVLAFTDADCRPEPGWLAAGLGALATGADLVGGAIVAQRSPSPSVWERYDRAIYLDQRHHVESEGFAATANLLIRREAFALVGGFDPRLRSSGDVDLGRRARAAGCTIAYIDAAAVIHRPRTTAGETWRLHRRLGAGWAVLARLGRRPPLWRDRSHWLPLGWVVTRVAADGPPLRRRRLLPVHLLAMAARLVGRLTARG